MIRRRAVLAAPVVLAGLGAAAQDTWPSRPVRVVVPSAPGDGGDSIARLYAAKLQEAFGQPFPVENRTGAGGRIGTEFAARAAPDGYTLIMGNAGSHGINGAVYRNLTYDLVHRISADTDEVEEQLFPTLVSRMRDNVLIFTEDHISPNLAELGSYFSGCLRLDGRDFRTRLMKVVEWYGRELGDDPELATVAADDDPERAIIGVALEDRITDFESSIDVDIDSGDVGGPSAGLAFTLAVLDVLTPGELTGGHRVAVTGTMDIDGNVGPVGGGAQKAIAVRNQGYEVFLVPSDELEEVQEAVGDDVRVIAVDTLDEALDALKSLGGNAGDLLALGPATASP